LSAAPPGVNLTPVGTVTPAWLRQRVLLPWHAGTPMYIGRACGSCVQRAQRRALSDARLSLSVPSPISFSRRCDMRSKSACDPEYLWCAAVLYCPATNAESASDESSSSVPDAYSEPPCCRDSRQP
jgi:hypothetical protein